jgi:hypothetical protein
MVDQHKIRMALRTKLLTVGSLPSSRAWENIEFTPPDPDTSWLRETLLFGGERLIATGRTEAFGIYQVDIFVPKGSGVKGATDLVKAIGDALRPEQSLTHDGVSVIIDRAEPIGGQADESWYWQSIAISWRSYGTIP